MPYHSCKARSGCCESTRTPEDCFAGDPGGWKPIFKSGGKVSCFCLDWLRGLSPRQGDCIWNLDWSADANWGKTIGRLGNCETVPVWLDWGASAWDGWNGIPAEGNSPLILEICWWNSLVELYKESADIWLLGELELSGPCLNPPAPTDIHARAAAAEALPKSSLCPDGPDSVTGGVSTTEWLEFCCFWALSANIPIRWTGSLTPSSFPWTTGPSLLDWFDVLSGDGPVTCLFKLVSVTFPLGNSPLTSGCLNMFLGTISLGLDSAAGVLLVNFATRTLLFCLLEDKEFNSSCFKPFFSGLPIFLDWLFCSWFRMLAGAHSLSPAEPKKGFPSTSGIKGCFPSSICLFTGCSMLDSTFLQFLSPFGNSIVECDFMAKLVPLWTSLLTINIGVGSCSYSPTQPRPYLKPGGRACWILWEAIFQAIGPRDALNRAKLLA